MSPANSLFLMAESREHPMHVGALELFVPPEGADAVDVRDMFLAAVASGEVAPLFQKRARRSMSSLGQWGWEPDDAFDLEHHVRASALPRPGRVLDLLSLGSTLHVGGVDTHVPLPAAILARLPVLDNLLPARFAVYVALFTALLFGLFVDQLPSGRRGTRVLITATVLAAAAVVPPLPFPTRAAVTPAYFTAASSPFPSGSALLVVPFSHDFYSTEAILWQAQAGISFSMPEGYIINRQRSGVAGQGPPPSVTGSTLAAIAGGSSSGARLAADARRQILTELQRWHIAGVVLGPMDQHGAEMRAFLTDLLGSQPQDREGVAVTILARTMKSARVSSFISRSR